ncbi:YqeG family HAD IIIA-type phosphatase [Nodosilinea sp. LEGE 07298]|uniref:YqeG family HAD IIIA-type phosphatase n=1 Tax=Nodosilinea sp. LEGE 07298 TaxID=2777970 RepID=UPI0018801426|nr:YqeG family HAD IIIA-type phosphatase [Nodosilinea sp. LEGE 07298]MBE9110404.1 YqeG family HAD IIIA-type phosphatase [Nodosilinea sp. LEGE 07298]
MSFSHLLQPDLVLKGNVLSISPDLLAHHGIRGLILDVDDTLVPLRQAETNPDLARWMNQIKAEASVWLVSNNMNAPRINRIADLLEVPYLTGAGKPSRRKLKLALAAMNLPVDQVAMVGDRLFTDVLAGNRIGLFTILVSPMPDLNQVVRTSPLRSLEVIISQYLGVTL